MCVVCFCLVCVVRPESEEVHACVGSGVFLKTCTYSVVVCVRWPE